MTAALKATIVEELHRCFAPASVARSLGISYECYRQHYHRDAAFKAAVDDARRWYTDFLRCEVHRRAVEGWEVPVFHRGKQCGTERRYSDRLLLRHIARFDPTYRQGTAVEQRTRITGRFENKRARFEDLPPETREALRALVQAEQERESRGGPCQPRPQPQRDNRSTGAA